MTTIAPTGDARLYALFSWLGCWVFKGLRIWCSGLEDWREEVDASLIAEIVFNRSSWYVGLFPCFRYQTNFTFHRSSIWMARNPCVFVSGKMWNYARWWPSVQKAKIAGQPTDLDFAKADEGRQVLAMRTLRANLRAPSFSFSFWLPGAILTAVMYAFCWSVGYGSETCCELVFRYDAPFGYYAIVACNDYCLLFIPTRVACCHASFFSFGHSPEHT